MAKDLRVTLLKDFYGKILTQKQLSCKEISNYAKEISEHNMRCAISKEISDLTVKIRAIANELSE